MIEFSFSIIWLSLRALKQGRSGVVYLLFQTKSIEMRV